MQVLTGYFRLFRWQNLLIILLLQVLLRYTVIIPLLGGSGMSDLHFFMLALAVVSVAAARYALNTYFEEYTELVRKRGNPFLYKRIKKVRAYQAFWLLSALGVVVAAFLSYHYFYWPLLVIVLAVPAITWLQVVHLKKYILSNHLLLTILAAAVPMIVWLAELRAFQQAGMTPGKCFIIANYVVYTYALFTALTTLLREVMKDLEDFRTDLQARYKSLPVLIGVGAARKLSVFLTLLILVGVAWAKVVIFGEGMMWLSAYLLVAVMLPFLLVMFMLLGVLGTPKYCQIQQLVKLVMLTGVMAMLVLNIYVADGQVC